VHRAICSDDAFDGEGGIGGVRKLVELDSSEEMLHRDEDIPVDGVERCESYRLVGDEEGKLPFPDGTFDLVISSQAIHWVNDLPGLFKEVKRVLKPDGCFMFSMIGGATLPELRISMTLAELEREGGVSPHVGPFVELSDIGGLMQSAGFSLPTIDIDTVKVSYPDAAVLMEHLQRMGEANASLNRRNYTAKDTFLAATCIYDEMFPLEIDDTTSNNDGDHEIEASVQIIYAIGWSPHASQQKPLQRGTATHKVGEIVEKHHTTTT
jgi:NADH dehydrogenase [ubiquinone] 1 alpha subcomplex assembly factor 5